MLTEQHTYKSRKWTGIWLIVILSLFTYFCASATWSIALDVTQVKLHGVEAIATVIRCVPERREHRSKWGVTSRIIYKHDIVYNDYYKTLYLDHEYAVQNEIPVKYLTYSPDFLVMQNNTNLSFWDLLDLWNLNVNEGKGNATNLLIFSIVSLITLCWVIILFIRLLIQKHGK